MFSHFWRKFKMATIFEHFLKSCHVLVYFLNPLGIKNFDEITLSLTVKEIEAILCFTTFGQNSKFKVATIFEKFSKSEHNILLRYPGGPKFQQNCSISNSQRDRSNFVFCHFWKKLENAKWPQFQKHFPKGSIAYCLDSLGIDNFNEIALSRSVKEIEAILCFHTFAENSKIQNGRHF